ncbi:hypothetical protein ABIB25_000831 [Nakamurella sp. UYEF19]|uniref:DUF3515 domain-containing protein n=1 Tax=Nakamurella sp. UYEF19 TaxID=1756392 RepID=UPI003395A422
MDVTTDQQPGTAPEQRSRPSWQAIAALVVVVAAIGVAVVLGYVHTRNPVVVSGPLAVSTFDQPGANSAACKSLMPALPGKLGDGPRRQIDGEPAGIAAWGDPAVILRCGLETPQDLTCSSALVQVNGVSWLQLTEAGLGSTTYIAADRSVRVAVTVPDGSGTAAIQQVSNAVSTTLQFRQPCSNGVLLPTDTR